MMKFENQNVEIATINGEPLFEIYSTGKALGYCRWNGKRTSCSPQKDRIDKVIQNAEITCVCQGGTQYFTESQLYDFMLEARTDKCRKFRKWVTNEVLPSIRKTGQYNAHKKGEKSKIIPLMYKNNPVVTIRDIYNNTKIAIHTIRHYIHKCLIYGTDYYVVSDDELEKLRNQAIISNSISMLTLITKSGVNKLSTELDFDISKELVDYFNRKQVTTNSITGREKALILVFDELEEGNKYKAIIYLANLLKEQENNNKLANNIINSILLSEEISEMEDFKKQTMLYGSKLLKNSYDSKEIEKAKEYILNSEKYDKLPDKEKILIDKYYDILINFFKRKAV